MAIQKSGRLTDDSLELLKKCGITFNRIDGQLKAQAYNFPLELLFLRNNDIPGYVQDGVADIAIIGDNLLYELDKPIRLVEKLGFSKCRLSIAVPKASKVKGIKSLNGLSIATSYPNSLNKFLKKNKIKADIHEISGSVEIAPGIGLADAICDLVSSGSTLMSNGLRELEVIFKSEAVLVANKRLSSEKQQLLKDLQFRINTVNNAKSSKYILLNAPNNAIDKIISILPGIKSPTVMPLAKKGWSSLHSVVKEDDFWEIIENLKKAGAQGILVIPIEKMIE